MVLGIVYGAWHTSRIGPFATDLLSSIYGAVKRTTWAVNLSWIVILYVAGYGGKSAAQIRPYLADKQQLRIYCYDGALEFVSLYLGEISGIPDTSSI